MPISFEEALKRLQKAEGLERGPAIDRLQQAYHANDPELAHIQDFNSSMVEERAKSIIQRAGIGAVEGIETPAEEILRAPGKLFGYGSSAPTYGEQAASAVRSQTETTPYAEGIGELAGSALPFTTLEKGAALLPLIGRSGITRQIVAGGILERADTGSNTVLGSVVAPVVLPKALEMAAGLVAKGARSLFGRGADVLPEADATLPEIDPKAIIGTTSAPETPPTPETNPQPFKPTPGGYHPDYKLFGETQEQPSTLAAAQGTILGPRGGPSETSQTLSAAHGTFAPEIPPPPKSGIEKTAEDLLTEHQAENHQFVGTANLRTGQPFEGTRTVLLSSDRGRVFVNADHPNAELGTPTPTKLANPAVFNVHDNPYRDALEQVFEKQPKTIDTFDQLEEPESFAREQLGRWAKGRGYDSVVLRAKDPKLDVILDYNGFMPSRHPYIGKGMSANLVNPPKSIFAKGIYDEGQLKTEAEMDRYIQSQQRKTKGIVDPLQDAADAYGFDSPKHLARAIRVSKSTPFELFSSESRWPSGKAPIPPIVVNGGRTTWDISQFRKANPEYADAIQTLANRRPRLMNLLDHIRVGSMGKGRYETTMATTHIDPKGNIIVSLNYDMMHTTPIGSKTMQRMGFIDPREWYATTLEHELTHVAQFWADIRGLHKTLGVPEMRGLNMDLTISGPVEQQAYKRDWALTDFFKEHERLQRRVAEIPDNIKEQVLRADIENSSRVMRPMLARKFNKLKGEPSVKVWAKQAPGFDPDELNGFDSDSRSLFDSQFDPERLISPEVKSLLDTMQRYGLKPFASFRRPSAVSDHPAHLGFISRIYELARNRETTVDGFNRTAAGILKEYGATDENYDKLFEAVENLRRLPDGSLKQLLPNLDEKTAKTAIKIRETITDPLYEHITGIDRRAPAILKELNLPDTDKQWTRIKLLQQGLTNKVNKPLMNEVVASQRMAGMLNFTEGHDIRGGFVDGYITNQPIANERSMLIDQIHQLQTLKMDPATQAEMLKRIKRLDEIETQMVNQRIKGLPARDTVPKRHFFGPVNVRANPGAAEILVDKNIPHIMGRYINGAVSKHFFDQALHEFRLVANDLPPSVRDYDTNYLNNLRGVRGYREDIGLVNAVNSFNEKIGIKKRVNLTDVRGATSMAMQFNNFFKLYANQVRFPIIQASHVLLTSGVVDPGATVKGMAYMLAKPKQAILEAMAKGVIERDTEFLGAMDEVSPSTQGHMLKYATAMAKYSDYFRKAVTYHGFRLRAMEPGFKPSSVIRTFIKDVAGRNTIQMARDYGAAATDILQFRLRAEGKPQAFVGGMGRRLWGQFKQWPINIGGLYADVIKSGDQKMMGRMLGTLWFFGGMSFGGGEMLYGAVRKEMLKRGHVLPEETGWQTIANQAGIGESLQNVNILSLRDPIGLPRGVDDVPSWIAGPTFGSMYDYFHTLTRPDTTQAQAVKATISGISPQLRAGVDAYEEFKHGGVIDPTGRVLAMREPAAIVIRGLDLSPSVRTQSYQVKHDVITALEAGQRDTAMQLLDSARKKGLVFGPKDMQEIKSKVRTDLKRSALFGGSWENYIR